jgi:hypothetical protein
MSRHEQDGTRRLDGWTGEIEELIGYEDTLSDHERRQGIRRQG